MKNSQVTIKGLTRIQANGLAILAEDGKLADILNERLEAQDLKEEMFEESEIPRVQFDEDDNEVHHEVDYDN